LLVTLSIAKEPNTLLDEQTYMIQPFQYHRILSPRGEIKSLRATTFFLHIFKKYLYAVLSVPRKYNLMLPNPTGLYQESKLLFKLSPGLATHPLCSHRHPQTNTHITAFQL